MDDFAGAVFVVSAVVALTLAIMGVTLLANDVRSFEGIVTVCSERGYIQNKTTRVYCHLEEVKK